MIGSANAPHHGFARHMQHELLELGIELQLVWPRAVVAGEVSRLEPRLAAVLANDADSAYLQTYKHHFFACAADTCPRPRHGLAVGPHAGKMQTIALGGRDLTEERPIRINPAIEFNKRIADRILPKLEAPALGDSARCQHGFHYTAPMSHKETGDAA